MKIFSHHSLKPYNTFGIEAFAREFAEVNSSEDLQKLVNIHINEVKPLFILSGGSNILFAGDVSALVMKMNTLGKEVIKENDDEVYLRVAAGEDWDSLVEFCVEKGWGGLENLSGIPGQVGSSPIQNIGAYGAELKDTFVSLEAVNICTGETTSYDAEQCQFGYRHSIFKTALKGRVVITHVVFRLTKKPLFNLTYQALKQKLEHLPEDEITLHKVREAVLQIRSSKLPDPKVIGNAGSFFKNPVVSKSQLEALKAVFPGIVSFEAPTAGCRLPAADFKIAAGWLIEQCGWKGYRDGDAGVHKDQALVLVNYGNASGLEILDLARKIQNSVMEKFGIMLEREVNVV